MTLDGRKRVVIEGVSPEIDCGRFPAKRVIGELVRVEADILTDGHDLLAAVLHHKHVEETKWRESPMIPLGNDRFAAEFEVTQLGRYIFTLEAWVDHFRTWARDLEKRAGAGQDLAVHFLVGTGMVTAAATLARGADRKTLLSFEEILKGRTSPARKVDVALSEDLHRLMAIYADRRFATSYGKELFVEVDRTKARFSTWYEMFPRSTSPEPGKHGTFRTAEKRLPYIASMGFDVLYLPPIHPIGKAHRKGRNNSTTAKRGEPGSPWAIGSEDGGHTAIHPELGTLADFRRFVKKADEHGLEIALDIAFQASPNHPAVKAHPEWFRWLPDNTVQYAENPPKKYEDIFPFDFESAKWRELWDELTDVFLYWCGEGIRMFRVDNPHTKPLPFWEWVIAAVKKEYPDAIFLAEAFTRPRIMYHLAKAGFSQSYTYFTWRNTKPELTDYFTELTTCQVKEFFRPNVWPNTPDILTEFLQQGGRPAFVIRLLLAATLSANYGIYGPAYELMDQQPREAGSEEYLDSEKYEIREWDLDDPDSLRELIARVNKIRRGNPALQSDRRLRFHETDNDQLICYSKWTADGSNLIVVVVSLDPFNTQSGSIDLSSDVLAIGPDEPVQMHDLLNNARVTWRGPRNQVSYRPEVIPGSIFRIRRRVRSERDFEYFL